MVFNAIKLQWAGYPNATVLETLVSFSSHASHSIRGQKRTGVAVLVC